MFHVPWLTASHLIRRGMSRGMPSKNRYWCDDRIHLGAPIPAPKTFTIDASNVSKPRGT
jgi:hypothetical protein